MNIDWARESISFVITFCVLMLLTYLIGPWTMIVASVLYMVLLIPVVFKGFSLKEYPQAMFGLFLIIGLGCCMAYWINQV